MRRTPPPQERIQRFCACIPMAEADARQVDVSLARIWSDSRQWESRLKDLYCGRPESARIAAFFPDDLFHGSPQQGEDTSLSRSLAHAALHGSSLDALRDGQSALQFAWHAEEGALWIESGTSRTGDVVQAAYVIAHIVRSFDLPPVGFDWAVHQPEGPSSSLGGAAFCSRDGIEYLETGEWLRDRAASCERDQQKDCSPAL